MDLEQFECRAEELRVLGMKISIGGDTVYEHYWDEDCRRNIYSASKSFTSCAVGFAVQEGLISLDEKLVDVFREELPKKLDENLELATVRDLLTMQLGQETGFLMGCQRPYMKENDWVRACLRQPFSDKPGSRFVYSNAGPYLAGILVQQRAGCNLLSYLEPRLFAPLGIRKTVWEVDPLGYTFGAGGLFLTISELHKLGMLYLQDGEWNRKQLLSKEWIRESSSRQAENDRDSYGYGYLFWRGPENSFRADGKYGQYSIVFRERNAVVSLFAESRNTNQLMDAIMNEVYPKL